MPAITQAARDYDQAMRQQFAMDAEKQSLELEKLQLDLAEKRKEQEMSSPSGRATQAADIAAFLEQEKQKESGIPIGEQMASKMAIGSQVIGRYVGDINVSIELESRVDKPCCG